MQLTAQIWNQFLQLVREGHSPFKGSKEKKSAAETLGIPNPLGFKNFIDTHEALKNQLDEAVNVMKKVSNIVVFSLSEDFTVPTNVHTTTTEDAVDFLFAKREETVSTFND